MINEIKSEAAMNNGAVVETESTIVLSPKDFERVDPDQLEKDLLHTQNLELEEQARKIASGELAVNAYDQYMPMFEVMVDNATSATLKRCIKGMLRFQISEEPKYVDDKERQFAASGKYLNDCAFAIRLKAMKDAYEAKAKEGTVNGAEKEA